MNRFQDWGAGTRDDFTGLIPSKISPDITTGDSPVITRYRWISPDITRFNIIHQDVVWSRSSHQSAVWPIRLCCKWRRILMFFLHRASIYWICTPVPLILLFWADARFERPFPRFMFLFRKPLRICAASGIYKSIGSWFSGAICIAVVNMRAWAGFAAWQERGIGEKWEKPHYLVDATGRKEILLRKWSQDELPWHQFGTPSFVLGITKFIKVTGWSSGSYCPHSQPWSLSTILALVSSSISSHLII